MTTPSDFGGRSAQPPMRDIQGPQDPDIFPPADPTVPPTEKGNWFSTCLIGCLITFVISLILCAGAGIYVYRNSRSLFGDLARKALVTAVESAQLQAEEETEVIAQIDRVVNAYKQGEISNEQVGRIFQRLMESHVMGLILIRAAENIYLEPSGLSEDEKRQAKVELQRVVRGMIEKSISSDQADSLLQYFTEEGPNGSRQLKKKLTDDELREMIAECKRLADEAEIPDEPYEVDVAAEVRQVVDQALNPGQ